MLYSKTTPEQKRIRFRELLASGTIQQFPARSTRSPRG
jgi:methylisocitrate lyase